MKRSNKFIFNQTLKKDPRKLADERIVQRKVKARVRIEGKRQEFRRRNLKTSVRIREPGTTGFDSETQDPACHDYSLNISAASLSEMGRGDNSHNLVFPAKRWHIARSRTVKQLLCDFWVVFFFSDVADCSRIRGCAAWREHPLLHHTATFRESFHLQHRSGV